MPTQNNEKKAWVVALALTILIIYSWWTCIIIVPLFPNTSCTVFGGTVGASLTGGTPSGDATCPICLCDRPKCIAPKTYLQATQLCMPPSPSTPTPIPTDNRTPTCVDCQIGNYDTAMMSCRCPSGTT